MKTKPGIAILTRPRGIEFHINDLSQTNQFFQKPISKKIIVAINKEIKVICNAP